MYPVVFALCNSANVSIQTYDTQTNANKYTHNIYIYIYREREREIDIDIYDMYTTINCPPKYYIYLLFVPMRTTQRLTLRVFGVVRPPKQPFNPGSTSHASIS